MEVRYYLDPDTGQPHIYGHGVTEPEVKWVLAQPSEDELCSRGSRQALGHTAAGRYLRVIYVPDEEDCHVGIGAADAHGVSTGRSANGFLRSQGIAD
jgi:hypothetical protein